MKVRSFLTLFLAFLMAVPVLSQESDSKKINKIKRDKQYLYAEATMKDAQEAHNTALELLNGYIDEYVKTKKKFKSSDNIIIKDIEKNSQNIQMKRGEMVRVFVYVKKSDIIPAENSTMRQNAGKQEDPADKKLTSEVTPITPDGQEMEGDASLRLSIPWQQEIIDNILGCSTLIEAKALMNRQKAEYKIKRIGNKSNCRNAAECFWVIANNGGAVVTVLGPGAETRTNFKTLQPDTLDNYKEMSAMWFTMAK